MGKTGTMTIKIDTNNVYSYAMALTARAGKNSEDYGNVAITEDNYPMLGVYLSSAVANAEGELRKKLSGSNRLDLKITEKSVEIALKEQTRTDLSVLDLVESSIRLYMAYYIATEWLRTTAASALCEIYGTTAVAHLNNAIGGLNQKDLPSISDTDYCNRSDSGNVRMDPQESVTADYCNRSDDNVLARPGTRTGDMEAITLQDEECCCRRNRAVSVTSEILISKP